MYDTSLSKYIKDMGLCKKKIKDAYPKKVCHMLRHVKKKERRKDSPFSKKKEKERNGAYKGVHTPSTKNISTHLHILIKVYDLFLLWIRSLT